MLSFGKHITQKDDPLTAIEPQHLYEMIRQPDEATQALINRLRLVKTIDKKQYGSMKRELPYVVCGVFNPPYRRLENFGYIEYFMMDIDHIAEKELSMASLRAKLCADSRVMLCFTSPGEDGLKVLFKLSERCHDAGQYSLFYKTFIRTLAMLHGFEQAVDTVTSDASRACFLSSDPEAYFNPQAETVAMKDFVDFDNPFAISELKHELQKEAQAHEATQPQEKVPRPEPSSEAIAFIKQKLQNKASAPRPKPQIYVPEELEQILEQLLQYIGESGIQVEGVENIQYGKKFRFRTGGAQAEINLFFGKKGFSVVKSPRQGTSPELNDLMAQYVSAFIEDYVMVAARPIAAGATSASPNSAPMSDADVLRQNAGMLNADKRFAEALPLYRSLWEGYREQCTEWDGWRYANCCKQIKDYRTALDVCRQIYKMNSAFEPARGLYAWCIYYTEIQPRPVKDEATFLRAAKAVTQLVRQADKYSAYTVTVRKVLDHFADKAAYHPEPIMEWTALLQPDLLDKQPFCYTDKDGQPRETASPYEQYFMLRTRALLEKAQWQECIDLCQTALSTIAAPHYDNDVWFRWRIALCYEGLGQWQRSLDLQLELLKRKREWFIEKEVAEQYFRLGEYQKALSYALDSALNAGDADKKINTYLVLQQALEKLGHAEEARRHNVLVEKLRRKDLPVEPELQALRTVWKRLKFAGRPQLTGTIKTLLPNGKAGFVEADNRRSYYFRLKDCKGKAIVGQRVNFFLEKGFDAKKNRETENAVEVIRV